MAEQVVNYSCPACTGPLRFDGASGKLVCDFCGNTYAVAEIEAQFAEKEEAAAQASQSAKPGAADAWGAEGAHMRAYNCPSCGAELICDDTTAATSCPYCGNPTVVPGQFSGTARPEWILPFRLQKEDAVRALKKHYEGKRLLPKTFSEENHIQEIKGVYVPFWLFSGEVDVDMEIEATRGRTYERGGERITETAHFLLERRGTAAFENVPVDASTKMPDGHMDSIEPFPLDELTAFSTAYLPGFLAEVYDQSAADCEARAETRVKNSAAAAALGTAAGFDSAVPVREDCRVRRKAAQYALFPVWMLSTQWEGQNYLFAMNGRTGRLVGDLPVSRSMYWSWFARIAGISTVVLSALLYFLLG